MFGIKWKEIINKCELKESPHEALPSRPELYLCSFFIQNFNAFGRFWLCRLVGVNKDEYMCQYHILVYEKEKKKKKIAHNSGWFDYSKEWRQLVLESIMHIFSTLTHIAYAFVHTILYFKTWATWKSQISSWNNFRSCHPYLFKKSPSLLLKLLHLIYLCDNFLKYKK